MDTSIFEAFPQAIISGVWQLGQCKRGTVVGNEFVPLGDVDVVIDDSFTANITGTPETTTTDMLIYLRPEQAYGIDLEAGGVANKLIGDYMLYNKRNDSYFIVKTAGLGKNQHTGKVEHIELGVVATDIADV